MPASFGVGPAAGRRGGARQRGGGRAAPRGATFGGRRRRPVGPGRGGACGLQAARRGSLAGAAQWGGAIGRGALGGRAAPPAPAAGARAGGRRPPQAARPLARRAGCAAGLTGPDEGGGGGSQAALEAQLWNAAARAEMKIELEWQPVQRGKWAAWWVGNTSTSPGGKLERARVPEEYPFEGVRAGKEGLGVRCAVGGDSGCASERGAACLGRARRRGAARPARLRRARVAACRCGSGGGRAPEAPVRLPVGRGQCCEPTHMGKKVRHGPAGAQGPRVGARGLQAQHGACAGGARGTSRAAAPERVCCAASTRRDAQVGGRWVGPPASARGMRRLTARNAELGDGRSGAAVSCVGDRRASRAWRRRPQGRPRPGRALTTAGRARGRGPGSAGVLGARARRQPPAGARRAGRFSRQRRRARRPCCRGGAGRRGRPQMAGGRDWGDGRARRGRGGQGVAW
jgi:hypothetical protein